MSSKEESSAAVAGAVVTTTATALTSAEGIGSTAASYANVLQNLESKKSATGILSAAGIETKTSTSSDLVKQQGNDNKENHPSIKAMKSWSDEVAAATEEVVGSNVAGEKRSAGNADNTAENSSEIDDNGDFLPVVSNHRRDRKKARKDNKPRDGKNVAASNNQISPNQASGNQKNAPVQRRGNVNSANGGTAVGTANDKDGERKFSARHRQRAGSPRKSNSGTKTQQQKERKDTSPVASGDTTNSGNESKTGDAEIQAQSSAAANVATTSNSAQPKKFVAAPPPKVNAWKVSQLYFIFNTLPLNYI